VCFFLFISFIIPLYLFNIICRVALLGFCFSGKITRFSQQKLISLLKFMVLNLSLVFGATMSFKFAMILLITKAVKKRKTKQKK